MAKRIIIGILGLALAALPATDSGAFFGLGKKKEKKNKERSAGGGGEGLPGMGGLDGSLPPRMAQERSEFPSGGSYDPGVSESETMVGDYPSPAPGSEMPQEIVIKGSGKEGVRKPPLAINVDPFDSIRATLKPDQNLLLAESPLTVVWRRTHPEFLRIDRVVQPWVSAFSEKPGVSFSPRTKLEEVLMRRLEKKEGKGYQWSLTIADEEGKVFQHWEGSSYPPENLAWRGQNDQGEWVQAGRAYSAVYMFTDPGGTPYTRVGDPIRYKGVVHQERDGLHITMDSSVLFGPNKGSRSVVAKGRPLMRSAADLIKRRYSGVPIRVEAYAQTRQLADLQAAAIESLLSKELMLLPQDVSIDGLRVPYTDQRLEIILLNR